MAVWRYMTDEEEEAARAVQQPPPMVGDAALHIFEVVEGRVSPYKRGMTLDISQPVEPGWFVCLVDEEIDGHTYNAQGLKVKMHDQVVELGRNALVVFFPPNYREIADGAG